MMANVQILPQISEYHVLVIQMHHSKANMLQMHNTTAPRNPIET